MIFGLLPLNVKLLPLNDFLAPLIGDWFPLLLDLAPLAPLLDPLLAAILALASLFRAEPTEFEELPPFVLPWNVPNINIT
jgi:hypothetical protein